jgi:hypothetical protein
MVLLLEENRAMPLLLLWQTVLPVMVLLLELIVIPAPSHELFVTLNPLTAIPSALNVIALSLPPASTTGCPIPLSVTDLSTTTFS